MSKKKKIIVLSCMIALLAVTAVCNFILTDNNLFKGNGEAVTTANYFTQYRSERLTSRNEELLQLDAIISAAGEGESDAKEDALAMKVKLTEITEQELLLENLIKAVGYDDVVVTIGINSDNVNIIVKSADLTLDDTIKIYTIVEEEDVATVENVKIIPIS